MTTNSPLMLPPLIPSDPRFPDRPAQAVELLHAVAATGGSVTKVQTAQALLLPPLNHRFFEPVLGNFKRLYTAYPEAFASLQEAQTAALKQALDAHTLLLQVNDPKLTAELQQSPRDSELGNLNYATGRHPLFALLMLEHPYSTARYLDLLLAHAVAHAISLRTDFSWEAYRDYIDPETRMSTPSPQPLNDSIVRIEFLGRGVTASNQADPFARLAERNIPLEIEAIFSFYREEAKRNHYSKAAVAFVERIDSFLKDKTGRPRGPVGGDRDIRDGLNLGTLLAGDASITASELEGVDIIQCVESEAIQIASDLDMVPEEVSARATTLLLDVGSSAGLPPSALAAVSRHMANQLARSQQLMVTRDTGLRPYRLDPVRDLLKAELDNPSIALLLRASIATGRPVSELESMTITTGASVDDADQAVEFDLVRQTWRIKVNAAQLRQRRAPSGARPTRSRAELPDAFGTAAVAHQYRASKNVDAQRVVVRWSPKDHKAALNQLKPLELTEDYLGRILPMALYQSTGDLATGTLISRWLPNSSVTYLHYLTVDRQRIAENYWQAAQSLKPCLDLPMPAEMPAIERGFVGMPNCPDDDYMRQLVADLIAELMAHPTATRADRAHYINRLSAYTVLYLTQGLGLRNSIDPDPDVQTMPAPTGHLGLAIFEDKRVSSAHLRLVYCPADLTAHMAGLKGFSARIQQEFPAVTGIEAPGLLPFIDEQGRTRRFHPSDIARVLGARFPFLPNALRRRARTRMYEYRGADAVLLGHGYSTWMGHWSEANHPHRHEASGLRQALRGVATQIIAPLLREDGWRPLPPRV